MINIKRVVVLGLVSMVTTLYAYEPSVYGAGDIDSATPYGLTKTEQSVLENKKNVQMLYNKINEQQRKVDGMTTIIEGQNKEILRLKEELKVQTQHQIKSREAYKRDSNKSYTLLLELGAMIDTIKNSYVSKDDLQEALVINNQNNAAAVAASTETSSNNNYSSNNYSTVNPSTYSNGEVSTNVNYAESYRKGVELFYQRSYEAAKEHFEEVLVANYKAAASNFYLGEIAYYTHAYENAVGYYKKSAALYDSASYMDVLYLHTAISLEKTGDKDQANGFYEYIIATYPDKKSASIARNRLVK